MLEKIGLSAEFINRFDEDPMFNVERKLKNYIEDDILDSNIYKLREDYDILTARIVYDAFGDDICEIDYSDFRYKFYSELIVRNKNQPIKLVGDDFILLGDTGRFYYPHRDEIREKFKTTIKDFIDELLVNRKRG